VEFFYWSLNCSNGTVQTPIEKCHTVGTVQTPIEKYHTVGTATKSREKKYHTVGTVPLRLQIV
jgi:hypothetical protein